MTFNIFIGRLLQYLLKTKHIIKIQPENKVGIDNHNLVLQIAYRTKITHAIMDKYQNKIAKHAKIFSKIEAFERFCELLSNLVSSCC